MKAIPQQAMHQIAGGFGGALFVEDEEMFVAQCWVDPEEIGYGSLEGAFN